jgi:hypothetical protein
MRARADLQKKLRLYGESEAAARLPEHCPYTLDQVLGDFWPEPHENQSKLGLNRAECSVLGGDYLEQRLAAAVSRAILRLDAAAYQFLVPGLEWWPVSRP